MRHILPNIKQKEKKIDKNDNAFIKSIRITIIYLIFGILWITLTDLLSDRIFVTGLLAISIVKGIFYVLITSCLIFFLIYPALRINQNTQRNLSLLNERLTASICELEKERAKLHESEIKLKESETLFHAVFDQVPIGIALIQGSSDTSLTFKNSTIINPMFEHITGRPEAVYKNFNWKDTIYPEDLENNTTAFKEFQSGDEQHFDADMRIIKSDNTTTWIHMSVVPLYIENNGEASQICIIEDIGQRKKFEEELFDSERSKAVLLDNLPGMAYRCKYDREWTMLFVSAGCFELTGYPPEMLLDNNELSFNDLISHDYREYLWNKWEHVLRCRGKLREEYELITASGDIKWVWEQGQGIYDEQGNIIAIEGLIIDITQRKLHEMQLKYINSHEMLTSIYNRSYFQEVLLHDFDNVLFDKAAIILINIKKFSQINANYGYLYGENLIKEIAECLKEITDINTQLFHVSVDRFVIYNKSYKDEDELRNICNLLTARLNTLLTPRAINGSIGVVEIDNSIRDIDYILKKASIAIENVQTDMNFGYGFFNSATEEKINRKIKIYDSLKKIAYDSTSENICMQFQPVINLNDGSVFGFEALARFTHDELGLVMPNEFITIAEEFNLIVPLGITIMRRSFNFLKSLECQGYNEVSLLINISPLQLLRDDFIPYLTYSIEYAAVDVQKIVIEITENVFINDFQKINTKLQEIRNLGIKVAIDDFGTGYSSLSREGELNIDCLKIDKFFIDKLNDQNTDNAITGDIISMAHRLGHYVIAEGVEHEKQMLYLIDKNCDYSQGYLYSRPVNEEKAFDLLRCASYKKSIVK
ncbi:MAG: EAL domain-containing protein [Eubacteriales bacterium]